MSAGNPRYTDMELISTTLIGSAGASSVTFTDNGAWAGYKHLQVRYVARSSLNAGVDNLAINFNSDTGTNYSTHSIYGAGSTVISNAFFNNVSAYVPSQLPAATTTANVFGAGIIDILDFANTSKYKTLRTSNGYMGAIGLVSLISGNWRSTSAITSITFVTSGQIVANSRISLYGVKA